MVYQDLRAAAQGAMEEVPAPCSPTSPARSVTVCSASTVVAGLLTPEGSQATLASEATLFPEEVVLEDEVEKKVELKQDLNDDLKQEFKVEDEAKLELTEEDLQQDFKDELKEEPASVDDGYELGGGMAPFVQAFVAEPPQGEPGGSGDAFMAQAAEDHGHGCDGDPLMAEPFLAQAAGDDGHGGEPLMAEPLLAEAAEDHGHSGVGDPYMALPSAGHERGGDGVAGHAEGQGGDGDATAPPAQDAATVPGEIDAAERAPWLPNK